MSLKTSDPVNGMDPLIRGDEDHIESIQIERDSSLPLIPIDHFYNYEEYCSKPIINEEFSFSKDLLILRHSFGYDSQKRSNLHCLNNDVLIFIAGNYIILADSKSKQLKYIRSIDSQGIGAIAVHPSKMYFAVAEKGRLPTINVFEHPSLRLYRVLRLGTEKAYNYVDFSPDGKYLASVGADPDYMLTLWDWRQESILLRAKAYSQEVFRVAFFADLDGYLTTAGTGHIRFWKMAQTFTGLKLQGHLGKFEKREISDIEGFVGLPDGKILSGCEWGNMILWDGGLIKVELSRKQGKACHKGAIQQILLEEGEIITVGLDGYIRVWDFDLVDTADISNTSDIFELEPMNELKVDSNASLKTLIKSTEQDSNIWFAQDAQGTIWKLDLSFSFTSAAPEKLFSFHSGSINDAAVSPTNDYVATIGSDCTIRIENYVDKTFMSSIKFNLPGTSLLWLPSEPNSEISLLAAGFDDGVLRILKIENLGKPSHLHMNRSQSSESNLLELSLVKASKPHMSKITTLAFDGIRNLLATGSSDCTIFFFNIGESIDPIGFISTKMAVNHLSWSKDDANKHILLVSCNGGDVWKVDTLEIGKNREYNTFELKNIPYVVHHFNSIKSLLLHNEELEKIKKNKLLGENIDRQEEAALNEKWQEYIPEKSSPVLLSIFSTDADKAWITLDDYDNGFLYEINFKNIDQNRKGNIGKYISMKESLNHTITCLSIVCKGKLVLLGMSNGSIRVLSLNTAYDLSSVNGQWSFTVHDNNYGVIKRVCLSHEEKYLISVGMDGNYFCFELSQYLDSKVQPDVANFKTLHPLKIALLPAKAEDISDTHAYSLEAAKQKSEYDAKLKAAETKKMLVRKEIDKLRAEFLALKMANDQLPSEIKLSNYEFEMDVGLHNNLVEQKKMKILNKEMLLDEASHNITYDKLYNLFKANIEYEYLIVKSFDSVYHVSTYRLERLSNEFQIAKEILEIKEEEKMKELKSREDSPLFQMTDEAPSKKLFGPPKNGEKKDSKVKGAMGHRIIRALEKVDEKKRKRSARQRMWSEFVSMRPDPNLEDPADLEALDFAKNTMGDFKLKSSPDYIVPDHLITNVDVAKKKLLRMREMIYLKKKSMNDRILGLRTKKENIIKEIGGHIEALKDLRTKLGKDFELPTLPQMEEDELPEKKYEFTKEKLNAFANRHASKHQLVHRQTLFMSAASVNQFKQQDSKNSLFTIPLPAELDKDIELEDKMLLAEKIRLEQQTNFHFNEITKLMKFFDAELRCLRNAKFQQDIQFINGDLRVISAFKELSLLKNYEDREKILNKNLASIQDEQKDINHKLFELSFKMESKKREVEELVEKEKSMFSSFCDSIKENKFADYLTRVYKKKIRRSKKKNETLSDITDSESESEDSSDFTDSEDDTASQINNDTVFPDLDVCPPTCDQGSYDMTCTLREKRLDTEEKLVEEKKIRDQLVKDLDVWQKKQKAVESSLKQAHEDLEAFQQEKQKRMNQMDELVTLTFQQIEYLDNKGRLKKNLLDALVFKAAKLTELEARIDELILEKSDLKRQQMEAKKKKVPTATLR